MRLITGALFLMVASLSPAGDLMADHAHQDKEHHTHQQVLRHESALEWARQLQRHHEFGHAASLLAELLEREPFNREAQLLYADVLLHDGRIDEARAACVRVGLSGAHTLAGYCAVQVLTSTGEYDRAFETAKNLAYKQLHNAAQIWALEISAIAAWKAGNSREAAAWFNEALAFPEVPHSTSQAYAAFLEQGR